MEHVVTHGLLRATVRLALDLAEISRGSKEETHAVADALRAIEREDFAELVEAGKPREVIVSADAWDDFLKRLVRHAMRTKK